MNLSLRIRLANFTCFAFAVAALLAFNGCQSKPAEDKPAGSESGAAENEEEEGHATAGPHGGDLVELGDEEYHAEVVLHNVPVMEIYVLDSTAKEEVLVPAPEIILNMKHGEELEKFVFTAQPGDNSTAEGASRFVAQDPEVADHLHMHGEAIMVIEIDGKTYSGKISHSHDH